MPFAFVSGSLTNNLLTMCSLLPFLFTYACACHLQTTDDEDDEDDEFEGLPISDV